MTIYEIKRRVEAIGDTYFGRAEMKTFGQTLKDFKVYKKEDGRYLITAPIRNKEGKVVVGIVSERYFNPANNTLELS